MSGVLDVPDVTIAEKLVHINIVDDSLRPARVTSKLIGS